MKFKNTVLLSFMIIFTNWMMGQNLVSNGNFSQYTTNCNNYSFAFGNSNCVPNWTRFSGSPSLHGVPNNPHAWMWSSGSANQFEGIQTAVNFEEGKCYSVSFKVRTNDRGVQAIRDNGTINLRAINAQGTTITSQQTIFSNTIGAYLGGWTTVTTTFVANANYPTLLVNPSYVGSEMQAEMSIDDIVITENNLSVAYHFENESGAAENTFCKGDKIFLDGAASQGENRYFIDAWRRPIGTTGNFQYVSGLGWNWSQLGTVDLTTLFGANGIVFQDGYEYQIKVALGNSCIGWLPKKMEFKVLPNGSLNSNFTMNTVCASNGKINVTVTANDLTANQWWGLFETTTATNTGGVQVGNIQGGTTTSFTGLSRTKHYYIKHGVWKDKDDTHCYPWRETRKQISNSVSWAGYTTNFAMSVSSDFNGNASVSVLANQNPVHVYHGWQVYDANHNLISGFCCSSDTASFSNLQINTWYYVKHGIWNDCKEWQETRKYFRIQIPSAARNNGIKFILETKEYPYEPDSGYTAQIEEEILSGEIFEKYPEFEKDKVTLESMLKVSPNPALIGENLEITLPAAVDIATVEIVNLAGQSREVRLDKKNRNVLLELDRRSFSGMCFVRITTNSGETLVKQLLIK